jgi:hypothetical protein
LQKSIGFEEAVKCEEEFDLFALVRERKAQIKNKKINKAETALIYLLKFLIINHSINQVWFFLEEQPASLLEELPNWDDAFA